MTQTPSIHVLLQFLRSPSLQEWAKIPTGVDVLLTHTPPANILDVADHAGRHGQSIGARPRSGRNPGLRSICLICQAVKSWPRQSAKGQMWLQAPEIIWGYIWQDCSTEVHAIYLC